MWLFLTFFQRDLTPKTSSYDLANNSHCCEWSLRSLSLHRCICETLVNIALLGYRTTSCRASHDVLFSGVQWLWVRDWRAWHSRPPLTQTCRALSWLLTITTAHDQLLSVTMTFTAQLHYYYYSPRVLCASVRRWSTSRSQRNRRHRLDSNQREVLQVCGLLPSVCHLVCCARLATDSTGIGPTTAAINTSMYDAPRGRNTAHKLQTCVA